MAISQLVKTETVGSLNMLMSSKFNGPKMKMNKMKMKKTRKKAKKSNNTINIKFNCLTNGEMDGMEILLESDKMELSLLLSETHLHLGLVMVLLLLMSKRMFMLN